MNIAVIGLGSMGKRRIRLMKEMYPEYNIVGIDGREDRQKETSTKFGINCYKDLAQVDLVIDCVFVCTSPLSHYSIIHNALEHGYHVFSELNLVADGYDENIILAKEKNVKLFLSSTFFYREELKYIREKIHNDIRWNYIYHIGQYLPDWHPWESYKDFFLGNKITNGCREILAIELPWLLDTFGKVTNINVVGDKITNLSIDYKDNFMIQLVHENGNKGCLIVDVVSPIAVRNLEIYSEGNYLVWNGNPNTLSEYDSVNRELFSVKLSESNEHIKGYSSIIVENAYKNEIKEFFEVVLNNKEPLYSFEKDKNILELIDRIGA